MTAIRAFVGHSFTADDRAVVAAFSGYFDSIEKSSLDFSWTHAEPAEPKALAEKVISLLRECNVKERTIAPNALSETMLSRGRLKGDARDFRWKTSDWIIQEIGLAIGRELKLILLLESGVEKPGGLQGDIEYVPFTREHPGESFQKILEMVSAILPRLTSAVATPSPDTRSPPSESKSEEATLATDEDWWMPEPGWSRRRHELALSHMCEIGDEEKAKTIYEEYLKTQDAGQDDNRQSWEAYFEYARFSFWWGRDYCETKGISRSESR